MKMKLTNIKKIIFYLILLLFFSDSLFAEAIRGRLNGMGPYGLYPIVGVAVTVTSNFGRSPPSYSDREGMYYIYNVQPGPYHLEIWLSGSFPIRYPITVYPNGSMTDIAPIRVK